MTEPVNQPVIRPASASDAAAIAALEQVLFGADAWSEAQVLDELTGYGRSGWVSLESSALVDASAEGQRTQLGGYAMVRTVGDVSDLQRIGVVPSAQRSGVAGRLLAAALAGVREAGAERMLLEVAEDNAPARAFYARHGFVEIDRRPRYYRTGAAALVLALDLV